jgi:hypothetical protein
MIALRVPPARLRGVRKPALLDLAPLLGSTIVSLLSGVGTRPRPREPTRQQRSCRIARACAREGAPRLSRPSRAGELIHLFEVREGLVSAPIPESF